VGGGLKQKKTLDSIKSKLGFPGGKGFKMFCRLGVFNFSGITGWVEDYT